MKNVKLKTKNVVEVFKEFRAERHAEDKGKHYNMLQETYANTELFDIGFIPYDEYGYVNYSKDSNIISVEDTLFQNISLPFESQFVKIDEDGEDFIEDEEDMIGNFRHTNCVFLREYSPEIITGTFYYYCRLCTLNLPFNIREGKLTVDMTGFDDYLGWEIPNLDSVDWGDLKGREDYHRELCLLLNGIIKAIKCLQNLPKQSVVCDVPQRPEYYARKHASTIKANKPIYYVLGKDEEREPRQYHRIKPIGHLSFDHSFKVRGHWRRINPRTFGKNRNGEYVMTGITWVTEHVRGEGELVKRIRVVK